MSANYVRATYKVPAKRGMRVNTCCGAGRITSMDHRVYVLLDDEGYARHPMPFHPTWHMTYYGPDGEVLWTDPEWVQR